MRGHLDLGQHSLPGSCGWSFVDFASRMTWAGEVPEHDPKLLPWWLGLRDSPPRWHTEGYK